MTLGAWIQRLLGRKKKAKKGPDRIPGGAPGDLEQDDKGGAKSTDPPDIDYPSPSPAPSRASRGA